MKAGKLRIVSLSVMVVASMLLAACGGTAETPTATTASSSAPTVEATATTATSTEATATTAMTTTEATATTATTATTAEASPTTVSATAAVSATMPPTIAVAPFSGDTIKIAVDLPTSGADASDGIPTRNGAQLAIEQANAKGGVTIGGKTYKLDMYALDDAVNGVHNPDQGVKNVQQFIADPAVLAMVGPFNSNVARAEMPILNVGNLANISPANTNETLTKPQYGLTGTFRPTGKVTYFRVCTTDDIQGPAGADYMYDKLNLKKVYVLDDTETYGKGIADNFAKEFTTKGGTVVAHEGVPKGTQDFTTIMTKIQGTNPDGIYYGGTSSNGLGVARKQMVGLGFNIPFMGGDGIQDKEFIDSAGAEAANGSYSTVAAVNASTLPAAKDFLAAYKTRFGSDVGAYSANAYESASIIINALGRATDPSREAVRTAIASTNYDGVIGHTSFDENGDTTNKWISIYEVKNGAWSFVDQIQFK